MIIKHRGIEPQIDPSAYIAPTATIVGNVSMGMKAKVMFGAVVNSEGAKISIGENAIISENTVIRATAEGNKDHPVNIGDNVFIGLTPQYSAQSWNLALTLQPAQQYYREQKYAQGQ
jgi:carbonic anhydrase/acetyltransferase-like protein (isoleucine patch superfamily)